MREEIIKAVRSGGYDKAHKLFSLNIPEDDTRRLKKALKGSEKFQLIKDTVWNTFGMSFSGIAAWGPKVTVRMQDYDYRFRILHLDRFGVRTVYMFPIGMTVSLNSLPQLDLNANELSVLREMAEELDCCIPKEMFIVLTHPARATVLFQCRNWRQEFEPAVLSDLLRQQPVLLKAATAALDCQLRVFKRVRTAPVGIYNFLPPKGSGTSEWLFTVFQALTFSNEPGRMSCGPLSIQLKDAEDLKRWRQCHERLAVIRTGTGSLLWPLLEEIEEQERILRSGGPLPAVPFPTVPIVVCRTALHSPYAVDIQLPETVSPLTVLQQDTLRSAMAGLLNQDTAKQVYTAWQDAAAAPNAYRELGFETWQQLLLQHILAVWIPGQAGQTLCTSVVRKQEQEYQEREDALNRGFKLLVHTEQYADEILDERPVSKRDALQKLSFDAVAFWFLPGKGANKGQKLLAFSGSSLKRLLRRVDCGEELYDAFIRHCEQRGIMDQRSRPITLSGESFTAVTFLAEKF